MPFFSTATPSLAAVAAAQEPAVDADRAAEDDLALVLKVEGPEPLPFQPVLLRRAVRNVGGRRLVQDDFAPARGISAVGVQGPGEAEFRVVNSAVLYDDLNRLIACGEGETGLPMVVLRPGQYEWVEFAAAAGWQPTGADRADGAACRNLGTPLFTEPGEYEIRSSYAYGPSSKRMTVLTAAATVRVRAPDRADDEAVIELLRGDRRLASALMSPAHATDPGVHERVRDLLERFPDSSYADYARFALARHRLRGTGLSIGHEEPAGEDEAVADMLEFLSEPDGTEQGQTGEDQVENVIGIYFSRDICPGGWRATVEPMVRARRRAGAEVERREEVERFVDVVRVTKADRAAAVRWLDEILESDREFAYRAEAMVALWQAVLPDDPHRAAWVAQLLDQHHADAVMWLEHPDRPSRPRPQQMSRFAE